MRITATTRTRDICDDSDEPESDCDERYCPTCDGTGIGQGDPDTSRCARCGGMGILSDDDDDCDDESGHDYDLSDLDDRPDYDPGDWGQPGDGNYYP